MTGLLFLALLVVALRLLVMQPEDEGRVKQGWRRAAHPRRER
jgi:hypothetical protein